MTSDDIPEAIFLESGDIVLMTGTSRLRYHGVPRIIQARSQPWNVPEEGDEDSTNLKNKSTKVAAERCNNNPYEDRTCVTMDQIRKQEFWKPFDVYIREARININVRQVM